jgi:uncharacterized membrane protein YhaH (DUF805 family)
MMKETLNDSQLNQNGQSTSLQKLLFSSQGRMRRTKYWIINLCAGLLLLPVYLIKENDASMGVLIGMFIITILLAWIGFATSIKRYHDLGKSGWFVLLQLIPIIGYAFIIYAAFFKGQEHDNKYGPNPYKTHI